MKLKTIYETMFKVDLSGPAGEKNSTDVKADTAEQALAVARKEVVPHMPTGWDVATGLVPQRYYDYNTSGAPAAPAESTIDLTGIVPQPYEDYNTGRAPAAPEAEAKANAPATKTTAKLVICPKCEENGEPISKVQPLVQAVRGDWGALGWRAPKVIDGWCICRLHMFANLFQIKDFKTFEVTFTKSDKGMMANEAAFSSAVMAQNDQFANKYDSQIKSYYKLVPNNSNTCMVSLIPGHIHYFVTVANVPAATAPAPAPAAKAEAKAEAKATAATPTATKRLTRPEADAFLNFVLEKLKVKCKRTLARLKVSNIGGSNFYNRAKVNLSEYVIQIVRTWANFFNGTVNEATEYSLGTIYNALLSYSKELYKNYVTANGSGSGSGSDSDAGLPVQGATTGNKVSALEWLRNFLEKPGAKQWLLQNRLSSQVDVIIRADDDDDGISASSVKNMVDRIYAKLATQQAAREIEAKNRRKPAASGGGAATSLSTLTCPHCSSVLRPAAPVPAGKKVRCPKCKEPFTASATGRFWPASKPGGALSSD